jgi:hypothetical protein
MKLTVSPSPTNDISNQYNEPSEHQLQTGLIITTSLRQPSIYIDQKIVTSTILMIISF